MILHKALSSGARLHQSAEQRGSLAPAPIQHIVFGTLHHVVLRLNILRRAVVMKNWAMCWLGEGAGVAVTAAISVPTLAAANAAAQATLPSQLSEVPPTFHLYFCMWEE